MSEAARTLHQEARGVQPLSGARAEFARLFNAGMNRDARRLALRERAVATGDLLLAWRNNLAMTFRAEGHLDVALDIHLDCDELVRGCRDLDILAKFYTGLGRTYELLGEFDKALLEYAGARDCYGRNADPFRFSVDNNVALVMARLGRFAEAHEMIERARREATGSAEFGRVAEMDDTRALVYEEENDLINAFYYSSRAVNALLGTEEGRALRESMATHARVVGKLNFRPE